MDYDKHLLTNRFWNGDWRSLPTDLPDSLPAIALVYDVLNRGAENVTAVYTPEVSDLIDVQLAHFLVRAVRQPSLLDIDFILEKWYEIRLFPLAAELVHFLAERDARGRLRQIVRLGDNRRGGWVLVSAEAALESGVDINHPLLEGINPGTCFPLSSSTAALWRDWLLSESKFWHLNSEETIRLPKTPGGMDLDARFTRRFIRAARLLYSRRQFPTIRSEPGQYFSFLQNTERHWETLYLQGLGLAAQGNMSEARTAFDHALKLNSYQSRVHFEAEYLIRGEVTACPAPDAQALLAIQQYQSGQTDLAIETVERIIADEPAYSRRWIWHYAFEQRLTHAQILRAHRAEQSGDLQLSRQVWDSIAQQRPLNQAERLHRVWMMMQSEHATKEIQRVLAHLPHSASARFWHLLILQEQRTLEARRIADEMFNDPLWRQQAQPDLLKYASDYAVQAGLYALARDLLNDGEESERRVFVDLLEKRNLNPGAPWDPILEYLHPTCSVSATDQSGSPTVSAVQTLIQEPGSVAALRSFIDRVGVLWSDYLPVKPAHLLFEQFATACKTGDLDGLRTLATIDLFTESANLLIEVVHIIEALRRGLVVDIRDRL